MTVTKRQEKRVVERWSGIHPETVAFARRMGREGRLHGPQLGSARDWLHTLREAGLSTGLDLDFEDRAVAQHLEDRIRASAYASAERLKLRHIDGLRGGLKLYELAFDLGLRTRPIPPIARRQHRRFATTHSEVRALLPEEDRERLAEIERVVRDLGRLQWEGRGAEPYGATPTNARHATISPKTAEGEVRSVNAFLQHCYRKEWKPFTLKELITPDRVCAFLFYGERCDGALRAGKTIMKLQFDLLDFFYRGRVAHPDPVIVISDEMHAAIEAQIVIEKRRSHLHQVRHASESNSGRYKWLPTLQEVELAIEALEQQIARAETRYACGGMTARQHWMEVRNATIALVTLFCMARSDTVSTISLSHLVRERTTGRILMHGGSMVVANIVRAKTKDRNNYPFVPELILPANVLPYIRRLLEIEGRSLEAPLLPGEVPVRLSAANQDNWGNTRIPSGDFEVVPLWRVDADSPAPLSYSAIRKVLESKLMELHFGSTNPHTFRATGAIYWTFVRGMPEEYVMRIGLWDSPRELRDNYARITSADRMRLMAAFIPLRGAAVPEVPKREREQAAADAIGVMTQLLTKRSDASEAEILLKGLQRQAERIERSIAAEKGTTWQPIRIDRFRDGEVELLDEALRGKDFERGISSVIGRDFWAEEALLRRAVGAATDPHLPPKIKHLKTTLATLRPLEKRKLRRIA